MVITFEVIENNNCENKTESYKNKYKKTSNFLLHIFGYNHIIQIDNQNDSETYKRACQGLNTTSIIKFKSFLGLLFQKIHILIKGMFPLKCAVLRVFSKM